MQGTISVNGTAAWVDYTSGLSVSSDGGRTWSAPSLPAGVPAAAVLALGGAPGRGFWLAVVEGDGARLYRTGDGVSWSSIHLEPSWPAIFQVTGPPELVRVSAGSGKLLTVALTSGTGTASAQSALFVSTDDGKTFVERPPTAGSVANEYWKWMTFLDSDRGVVGIGPETGPVGFGSADLIYTSDGGKSWLRSKLQGLPPGGSRDFQTATVIGSDLVLPVTTWDNTAASANATLLLLVSHDYGATFSPLGSPGPVSTDLEPVTATLAQVTWVVARPGDSPGSIYESSDAGTTWSSVPAPGLIVGLSLTGPASAVAVVDAKTCDAAQGCYARTYLVVTTDGGRTWNAP